MFTETLTAHDDTIGLACEGKLSESDLKRMHALLHERLQETSKPGLVLDLTRFEGYDGPSALLEDLKIDTAHRNDFHYNRNGYSVQLVLWNNNYRNTYSN